MTDKEPEDRRPSQPTTTSGISQLEYDLRRYEARMSFWKIAVGTALVGLASVLVPGAIQFWDLQFKNARQAVELDISKSEARRDEITTFIEYALNEDIELRLRMAEYFSVVTEGNSTDTDSDRARWTKYHSDLGKFREDTKTKILDRERRRARLERTPVDKLKDEEAIELVVLDLELKWLYGELGRAARGRSVIATANETISAADDSSCPIGEDYFARDNKLQNLHPAIRDKVASLIAALNDEGIPFQLFEGFRSPFRQSRLYATGRTKPGNKITWIAPWQSAHQYGLAADLVLRTDDGEWSWDTTGEKRSWWDRMHELAKEQGLTPIYNSKGQLIEIPHIQLKDIRNSDLLDGNLPAGGDADWARNLFRNAQTWRDCGLFPNLTNETFAQLAQALRVADKN